LIELPHLPTSDAPPQGQPPTEVDAALLALDAIAREYNPYEFGLPAYQEGDAGPLADFDDDRPCVERMREVLQSYARQAVQEERERCAALCEALQQKTFDEAPRPWVGDWELDANGNDCAAAIRAQK